MKIKFYTEVEKARIAKELAKGKSPAEVSRLLSPIFNRSSLSIEQYICYHKNKSKKIVKPAIPEGFTMSFIPSKVEMNKNSVTLYW